MMRKSTFSGAKIKTIRATKADPGKKKKNVGVTKIYILL